MPGFIHRYTDVGQRAGSLSRHRVGVWEAYSSCNGVTSGSSPASFTTVHRA
jgi:hypothetical protein